jgi:AcrR family transcriptional regulator
MPSSAPATSAVPQPDTRTRILDSALELFSEQGFDGTTLQQIADRLGFTKAAIYYHFRSKDDLLEALVSPALAGLDELLEAHEGQPDTPGERRRFIEDYLDHLLGHRRLIAYMSSDLAILAHPVLAIGSAGRRARLERKLAGDGRDFNVEVRVAMAFRGIAGAIAQYPNADTVQLRNALLDAVRALLRPPRRRTLVKAARPQTRAT